ncbi:MAG: hypothetical protein K2Q18_03590 [Bdellovibrionales bacterium]|nr:hypothetical protein [Bdellovibrionales bacterium]
MKTKTLITLCLTFITLSTTAFADNVKVVAPALEGKVTITTPNLTLTDWQAVMSCHFDYKGSRKESVRYPQTFVKKTENETEFSISAKKGSLTEYLPGWRLLTCAYKLILLGKDTDSNKAVFGEIYLLGQEFGEMDPIDLKDMQNKDFVAKVLTDKFKELKLGIATTGGIVLE